MMDFDVVDLETADHVEEGDVAPDFTRPLVTDEFWEDRSLSDLCESGPVLLVFHPMDGAFPTTYVWKALADRDLDGVRPVGVSISSPYEHSDLVEWAPLDLAAFSDPANEVAESYGVAHDLDGMTGVSEPRPAVFLVAPDRTVEYAWVAGEWPAFPDYDAVERAIAER